MWDSEKNEKNRDDHGLGFETASVVFSDPFAVTQADPYRYEQRWRTMGMVNNMVVIVVDTTPEIDANTGEMIGRIISARQVTRHERRRYEELRY